MYNSNNQNNNINSQKLYNNNYQDNYSNSKKLINFINKR